MTTRRLRRLFGDDGRSLVVAMDHPAFADQVQPGLADPEPIIRAVVAAGSDALLLPPGSAERWSSAVDRAALIVSLPLDDRRGVATALRIGADAVKVITCPWLPGGPDERGRLSVLAAECHRWGLPLMVETVPGGWDATGEFRSVERLAVAARTAAELGADVVKTFAPESGEETRQLVEYATVPVLLLGGGPQGDRSVLRRRVAQSLAAGAAGLVIGRNIWGVDDPQSACAELVKLVHGVSD